MKIHVREEHLTKLEYHWEEAEQRLLGELDAFRPELVGFSVVTPGVPETQTLSEKVRHRLGDRVILVAGGIHPTVLPENTLQEIPALDAVAVGEGEDTLCEIAERGLQKDVAGLVLRDGHGFFHTPPRRRREELDAFAPLPYDRLYDMDYYTAADPWRIRWLHLRSMNLRTSRGCTNRCHFCSGHTVAGIGVRLHSPDYVIDRMEQVLANYSVEAILFEDETLGADPDRLVEICRRIRQRGWHTRIRWAGCLRVDQADGELLAEMRAAGCIQVEYGFETGSARMLKTLGKGARIGQNDRAVDITRKHGLRIFANVMIGLPGETEEDFLQTIEFIRRAKPDVLSAAQLTPLPGTPIYNSLPAEVRNRLQWGGYAYADHLGFRINITSMPDDVYFRHRREFFKYLAHPLVCWQLLRDAEGADAGFRRPFERALQRLSWRHPIHYVRLPRWKTPLDLRAA